MRLDANVSKNQNIWEEKGYKLPQYDREKMILDTRENPIWIHFGAGNIFRAFQANVAQKLLNEGVMDQGIIVAEGFDYEIVERMYRPNADYSILVTLKVDGSIEKTVVGSIAESCVLDSENDMEYSRLKEIFRKDSLQMATFTITEKGYSLVDGNGELLKEVALDYENGPKSPASYMGKAVSLLYARYLSGEKPIAMVSTDNCSHNGDKLYAAIYAYAKAWEGKGLIDSGFIDYINDKKKVSFPWSMIDKITPRPDASVETILREDGLEGLDPVITSKNTYVAPFVNAEECEYLVIEDEFPNGRPALEKGGVLFTDRETVDKVERMKVCTCLNPLYTALAIYGCLLGYTKISEEMKNPSIKKLVEIIGYREGLPVVVNPGVLNPKEFIDTVLQVRIPNPFMPDTPQRIATDTSQKLAIRYGETIKNYQAAGKNIADLKGIPLVLAGWLRYLMAIDDDGQSFTLSPDPLLETITPYVSDIKLGDDMDAETILRPILEDEKIWGVNLYAIGMAEPVCKYFEELTAGKGAVAATLRRYTTYEVLQEIEKIGIVPVVVLEDAKDAKPLAKALCEGGLPCAEVTFRTRAAKESIRIMSENYPELLVGAGTVLTIDQVDHAVEAGAKFIVSPGLNPTVVNYCMQKGIPVIPGTANPSDIEIALEKGLEAVKFFPAEPLGGLKMIKALSAPYVGVKFMPTGGISMQNVKEYLAYDRILACGGSWMVKDELIKTGDFEKITGLVREAADLVKEIRE